MNSMIPSCVIIIPVYKPVLSADEKVSLVQCLRVLKLHSFVFVTPKALDCELYRDICSQHGIRFNRFSFDDSFFVGVEGYNRLLLSCSFYEAFADYDYMLIYQLDAYVFVDELNKWCSKGYDYIGAPLIGNYQDEEFSMSMHVGNGGFSLRRVGFFLSFFNSRKNVFSGSQIARLINIWKKPYTRCFVWLLMVLGWRNKPSVVASRWEYNEDDFWSARLSQSNYQLSIPEPLEALQFSFERFPSQLFELNSGRLPFGCHAWRKYQFDLFWVDFIKAR